MPGASNHRILQRHRRGQRPRAHAAPRPHTHTHLLSPSETPHAPLGGAGGAPRAAVTGAEGSGPAPLLLLRRRRRRLLLRSQRPPPTATAAPPLRTPAAPPPPRAAPPLPSHQSAAAPPVARSMPTQPLVARLGLAAAVAMAKSAHDAGRRGAGGSAGEQGTQGCSILTWGGGCVCACTRVCGVGERAHACVLVCGAGACWRYQCRGMQGAWGYSWCEVQGGIRTVGQRPLGEYHRVGCARGAQMPWGCEGGMPGEGGYHCSQTWVLIQLVARGGQNASTVLAQIENSPDYKATPQ